MALAISLRAGEMFRCGDALFEVNEIHDKTSFRLVHFVEPRNPYKPEYIVHEIVHGQACEILADVWVSSAKGTFVTAKIVIEAPKSIKIRRVKK